MSNTQASPQPAASADRVLCYYWMGATLEVLVPKKRGSGFLRVPLGEHHDADLSRIESLANCDIFGLDGALSFQCGSRIASYEAKRKAFESVVLPALERHYGCTSREVSHTEFFNLHPQHQGGKPQ